MSEGVWFDGRNPFSPDNNAGYYWGSSNGNSDHPAAGIMV